MDEAAQESGPGPTAGSSPSLAPISAPGSPSGSSGIASPEVSVVVPFWNERLNVLPLARQVFAAFSEPPRDIELLLVDDASTDGTWEQILEARRLDRRVRPLRLLQHSGQSAALWTGFKASRAQVIATLDGDLQNDPADLPRLLAQLTTCDMVCGVRLRRMDSALRRFSTWIARAARKLILQSDFRDTGCNLRVFKRSLVPKLLPFDGLHRFMPILAQDAGAVVLETPVAHHARTAGRSKYGVWNRLGRGALDLAMLAWYRRRRLPQTPVSEPAPDRP